jgi:hypothetical protein
LLFESNEAEGKIHLSDLIVLGHAVEFGALDGEFVDNGECAG